MPNENVQTVSLKSFKRFTAMLADAFPINMPQSVADMWTNDATALNAAVQRTFIPPEKISVVVGSDFAEQLKAQENFWRRLFPTEDFGFDPANMLVWPRTQGHDRLLVTPRGLWANRLYEKCEEKFTCWRYTDDLDKMVHLSGLPYVATARWFRDQQEADEELASKSALDLEALMIPGITLPERELYELVYFEETGDHLDKDNATLVAGSRYPGGHVPGAIWRSDGFRVDRVSPRRPYRYWRSRAAA